jgi:hypothetical protein
VTVGIVVADPVDAVVVVVFGVCVVVGGDVAIVVVGADVGMVVVGGAKTVKVAVAVPVSRPRASMVWAPVAAPAGTRLE